jgi:DNA-binding transcriptional MerR regulator
MTEHRDRIYTQREVNQIFKHLPTRTILSWAERGLISCVREDKDGRGRLRLYSFEDLFEIAVVEELTSLNFTLEFIHWLMQKFHGGILEHMDKTLVIKKHRPGREGNFGAIAPLFIDPSECEGRLMLEPYPTVIIMNLPEIRRYVSELVNSLKD